MQHRKTKQDHDGVLATEHGTSSRGLGELPSHTLRDRSVERKQQVKVVAGLPETKYDNDGTDDGEVITHLKFERWRWRRNDVRHHLGAHELIPAEQTSQNPDEDSRKRHVSGARRARVLVPRTKLGGRVGQRRVGRKGTGSIFGD